VVLALMPGSGDSIQALKAGIMEIPDVIVVNKADHPLTDTMVREIRNVLSLARNSDPDAWKVPILKTEALTGAGVDELVEVLDAHRAHIEAQGTLSERRRRNLRNEVISLVAARLRRDLERHLDDDARFGELLDEVVARRMDPASAASEILGTYDARSAAEP
jgi:LAO/AO transport system kinase